MIFSCNTSGSMSLKPTQLSFYNFLLLKSDVLSFLHFKVQTHWFIYLVLCLFSCLFYGRVYKNYLQCWVFFIWPPEPPALRPGAWRAWSASRRGWLWLLPYWRFSTDGCYQVTLSYTYSSCRFRWSLPSPGPFRQTW